MKTRPQSEPEKPRFLLPEGCKDLIDAIRLRRRKPTQKRELSQADPSSASADPPQPLPASVALPDPIAVRDLAAALHLKPFEVIGALIRLNLFALSAQLDFDTASALCSHYGVAAIKVA